MKTPIGYARNCIAALTAGLATVEQAQSAINRAEDHKHELIREKELTLVGDGISTNPELKDHLRCMTDLDGEKTKTDSSLAAILAGDAETIAYTIFKPWIDGRFEEAHREALPFFRDQEPLARGQAERAIAHLRTAQAACFASNHEVHPTNRARLIIAGLNAWLNSQPKEAATAEPAETK